MGGGWRGDDMRRDLLLIIGFARKRMKLIQIFLTGYNVRSEGEIPNL